MDLRVYAPRWYCWINGVDMFEFKSRYEVIRELSSALEKVALQREGDLYYQLQDGVTEAEQQEYENICKLREALKPFLSNEVING